MATNGIVQYTSGFLPYILLFSQAPILVWFDGTIIDIISTILLTMYYSGYVGLSLEAVHGDSCKSSVHYNGGFLPDNILLTQGHYHWETRLNTM